MTKIVDLKTGEQASEQNDDAPLEGTVFNARQVRVLKIIVVTMGVVLIAGFAFIVGTIVYRAGTLGDGPSSPAQTTAVLQSSQKTGIPLPSGSVVKTLSLDGNRLAVHTQSPKGDAIVIIDIKSGSVLRRIALTPERRR